MADTITHALSGATLAVAIPSASFEEKIAIVAGTILPDLIFTPYIMAVAKEAHKNIKDITENDFTTYGYSTPKIRFLKKIYFISHGLPLVFFLLILGNWQNVFLFIGIGFLLHILYDLFTHKYIDENFMPHPLYPLFLTRFRYGFTNGWRITWKKRISIWAVHLILIFLILEIV